jgi:hypothetical protein
MYAATVGKDSRVATHLGRDVGPGSAPDLTHGASGIARAGAAR